MSLLAEYEQDFRGTITSIEKRCTKIPDLTGGALSLRLTFLGSSSSCSHSFLYIYALAYIPRPLFYMSLSPCTHAAFHVLDDCVRVAKRSLLATNAVHHVRPSTFSFSFARRDEELRESTVTITSVLGLVAPDNLTHNLPLYLAVPASNTPYIVHSHTCECFSRENR